MEDLLPGRRERVKLKRLDHLSLIDLKEIFGGVVRGVTRGPVGGGVGSSKGWG